MPTRTKHIEIAVITPSATAQPRLRFTPLQEIEEQEQRWLWGLDSPLSRLSLLGGREGVGKSLVACNTAAKVTRGTLPGTLFGSATRGRHRGPRRLVDTDDQGPTASSRR